MSHRWSSKSKLHAPVRDVLGRKGADGFVLPSRGGAELRGCTHDSSINFAAAGAAKVKIALCHESTKPVLDSFLHGLMAAEYLKSYENPSSEDGGGDAV